MLRLEKNRLKIKISLYKFIRKNFKSIISVEYFDSNIERLIAKRNAVEKKLAEKKYKKLIPILKEIISPINENLDRKFNERVNDDLSGVLAEAIQAKILQELKDDNTKNLGIIDKLIQANIHTAFLHQKTFASYKNCFEGKEVVLVATGPSLNDFDTKIFEGKDVVYIGVKAAFMCDKFKLDYLFMQDYYSCKDYLHKADEYEGNNCQKFYALASEDIGYTHQSIPESSVIKANAKRYKLDRRSRYGILPGPFGSDDFAYDLSCQPIGTFDSTIFTAAQFAFWGNPKKIYLLGCDCSSGYFVQDSAIPEFDSSFLTKSWQKFKQFRDMYYPETEIISINPIGLKGLFKDICFNKEIINDNKSSYSC